VIGIVRGFTRGPMARWLVVGIGFTFVGTPMLYVFRSGLSLPLPIATVLVGELTILPRFLINDRWVFGYAWPSWLRLGQYHVASIGGFTVWWAATNLLSRLGVHYLIASLIGTGGSVGLSILTNFVWIWRARRETEDPALLASQATM